ncbi:hypothetical protein [Weissella paramesenteroides]|uniref:hypothetical protein n=1 Tax=Weissella paramesenteroides TaxID=1249 RepID=UPI00388FEACB
MQTLSEFRQKLKRKNQNRLKYLKKKFKNYSDEDLDQQVADEVHGIINVSEILDYNPTDEKLLKRQIAIKTSRREVWYRNAMSTWLSQHPEVGVSGENNAGMYRFAFTFFVNQVILNPKNNNLSYGDLLKAMDEINDVDPMLNEINYQMKDLKEIASFIAAMEYLENITSFGPDRQLDDVIQTDIRSELDDSSQYAKDFAAYQERRKQDLAHKQKRHSNEGLEFKHD